MKNVTCGISHMIKEVPLNMMVDEHMKGEKDSLIMDMKIIDQAPIDEEIEMDDLNLEMISFVSPTKTDGMVENDCSFDSEMSGLTVVRQISDTQDTNCDSPII